MTIADIQTAIGATPDGQWGQASILAFHTAFRNPSAPAVTSGDVARFADRLGCSVAQLNAVASVESGGGSFDRLGRPKILYERHIFHRLTGGQWSVTAYSNPSGGGYDQDSWAKLAMAIGKAPDAAFSSCSWGRFQVMGKAWGQLGYTSPFELAMSTVKGEAGHYELLCRFIEKNGLADELRSLSADPDDCRPFARLYNGPGYEANAYHSKLARALG